MRHLLPFIVVLFASSVAGADTVKFAGATISVPDGWDETTEKGLLTIGLKKGGAFVEVYDFSKVLPNDAAQIKKALSDRKETTDITVSKVEAHEQAGHKGIYFVGKAKIKKSQVVFAGISLAFGDRAILAIVFEANELAKPLRSQAAGIISSVK